jgi:hypothetical protein
MRLRRPTAAWTAAVVGTAAGVALSACGVLPGVSGSMPGLDPHRDETGSCSHANAGRTAGYGLTLHNLGSKPLLLLSADLVEPRHLLVLDASVVHLRSARLIMAFDRIYPPSRDPTWRDVMDWEHRQPVPGALVPPETSHGEEEIILQLKVEDGYTGGAAREVVLRYLTADGRTRSWVSNSVIQLRIDPRPC